MIKDCKRISIIGQNGSGKTTLSRILGQKLSLPIVHVDSYIYSKNWVLNDRKTAEDQIKKVLANQDSWIIDGYINYAPKEMLELADMVIYLDYSKGRAFLRHIKRWWKHRKNKREELPEGCEERLKVKSLYQVLQGGVVKIIEDAITKYPAHNLVRIKSPKELRKFLRDNF